MTTQGPPSTAPDPAKDSPETGESPAADASVSDAFRDAARRLGEIREYVAYYLSAQADTVKLAVRNGLIYAVLMTVGVLAVVAVVMVSVTLLLVGVAGVLAEAIGARFWLGAVIVGVVVLAAVAIMARVGFSMVTRTFGKQTVEKYESRKREQREQFGHDVDGRDRHADR